MYIKAVKRITGEKDPLTDDEVLQEFTPNKKGAGRKTFAPLDSHFAVSDHQLWLPTNSSITQTEPCGPLRGGEPEPYGHWWLPFSYGNRAPWICGDGWVDRYASFVYTSCQIHICSTVLRLQRDIVTDYRYSHAETL